MGNIIASSWGAIKDIGGIFNLWDTPEEAVAEETSKNRSFQQQLWERQFGPVNDALRNEMMKVLTPEWKDKFKETMRTEIESGIRPGEESAKAALLDKVRASPRSMSSQSYAKGLKDIVREGSAARGTAYRSGMSQAELTPLNLSLAFMGRTPYSPNVTPTYPPDYKVDTEGLKMMGSGLGEMVKAGSNLYNTLYGPREVSGGQGGVPISSDYGTSGFEEYGWD